MFLLMDGLLTLINLACLMVYIGEVSYGVGMIISGKGGSEVFPKFFAKGSCRFTNVLLIKLYSVTLIPVHHSTFLCDGVSVLEGNQDAFDAVSFFEVNCLFPVFNRCF